MKLRNGYLKAATAVWVLSICAGAWADEDKQESRDLEEASKAWVKAVKEADKAVMERILTEDCLHVAADGKCRGRMPSSAP